MDNGDSIEGKGASTETENRDEEEVAECIAGASDHFAIIPEVVMRDYLDKYIGNPKEKFNLSQASPGAAALLKPSMPTWIFNELFPIQAFQDLFSKSETLAFRLVCKAWRKSINNFNEMNCEAQPNYRSYRSILSTTQHSSSKIDFEIMRKRSERTVFILQ